MVDLKRLNAAVVLAIFCLTLVASDICRSWYTYKILKEMGELPILNMNRIEEISDKIEEISMTLKKMNLRLDTLMSDEQ